MQLVMSGVHVDIGDSFRQHVESELEAFNEHYQLDPIEVTVQMSKEVYQFRVDIFSHIGRGTTIRSNGYGDDAYMSFNNALHHLAERLRRHKQRLVAYHKHHGNRRVPAAIAPYYILEVQEPKADKKDGSLAPPVVAELKAEIPKLTVSEAVMRLDLSEQTAMMFYNESHGGLNMVYHRKDGNIGWVDPDEGKGK